MSDVFEERVPVEFIRRAFEAMERACWHQLQILTTRAEGLEEIAVHAGSLSVAILLRRWRTLVPADSDPDSDREVVPRWLVRRFPGS